MSYLKIGKYDGDATSATTYQFKVVLDIDYIDISSVREWFKSVSFANKDFIFARDGAIAYITNNGGFNALNDMEKELVSKHFCVDKVDRDTVLSEDEQESFWELFVYNSQNARQHRWDIAKSFISYRLSPTDSSDIAVTTDTYSTQYIRYGIEELSVDGKDGLRDWIKNEGNLVVSGFNSKQYYTDGLRDGLLERLDGIITTVMQDVVIEKIIIPSKLK